MRPALVVIAPLLLALSCQPGDDPGPPPAAADMTRATCAVCGMVVQEQLAPRAQVVHRDGERAFLCALSELDAYLTAPSPHGGASAVFVETLDADMPPAAVGPDARPWIDAERAAYVVDGPTRRVMGRSVLAYAAHAEAAAIVDAHGGQVTDLAKLRVFLRSPTAHAAEGAAPPPSENPMETHR